MTHREARASLGSRTVRRAGTKTKVIPGGSQKKPPKYRFARVGRNRTRPAILVARKVRNG
jgi:hypothetical protein